MTDVEIIEAILRREGGFTDHPADRGGPTNFGITQRLLTTRLGRPATIDDLKAITKAEARAIYHDIFIVRPNFTLIADDALRALVVDCGVLHGPRRASQWLQESLGGLVIDGVLGPQTFKKIHALDADGLRRACKAVLARRYAFIADIVAKDASQRVFLCGWVSRCNEFLMEI